MLLTCGREVVRVCEMFHAGEVLRGDRIVNTPFTIEMNKNRRCEMVCSKKTLSVSESKLMAARIREEYYVHL